MGTGRTARVGTTRHLAKIKKQVGRPPLLGQVIDTDEDGNDILIEDRILTMVRSGNYIEVAAACAGVDKEMLYTWLSTGAKASRAKIKDPGLVLTANQRRCLTFSKAIVEAAALSEAELIAGIQAAGTRRRLTIVTTRKRVKVGDEWQETVDTKTEEAPPDWRALAWRAERRFTSRWGQRGSLEVSGPDGGPIELENRGVALARRLMELRAGESVIDVEPVEEGEPDAPEDAATEPL